MTKNKQQKRKATEESTPRFNVLIGLIAAFTILGLIALAVRQKYSQPLAPVSAATPAPSPVSANETPAAPSPSEFTATEVAAAPRISVKEAKRLVDEGGAVVIDVRNIDNYAAGHISGSLQIPLEYVQGEIPWFPKDKKLITYCT
jgi:Rhodanese-like domain